MFNLEFVEEEILRTNDRKAVLALHAAGNLFDFVGIEIGIRKDRQDLESWEADLKRKELPYAITVGPRHMILWKEQVAGGERFFNTKGNEED